jgi:hypothetical protein
MDQVRKYLKNAENCVELAESAKDAPSRARYKRMAEGWLALVHEEEWLAGKVSPLQSPPDHSKTKALIETWPSPKGAPHEGQTIIIN